MNNNEQHWKLVQTKTFTKWVNSKLSKVDSPPIEDLFKDISTGIPLINLLKALGKGPIRYNSNPFSRILKMENLSYIIDYIKDQGIVLINIGPSDIVDGDQKLILGLIWTIISKMTMGSNSSLENNSMREELLEWVQKVTESYDNVNVKNFTSSWVDGIAFNAIIHKFRPNLIPNYFDLSKSNSDFNMQQAFTIAEKNLDIPRLFDPEDITQAITPDEKSIMTYVSQFYHKFKPEEQEMINKDKLTGFLRGLDWSISARNQYEQKASKFIQDKNSLELKISQINQQIQVLCDSLKECEAKNGDLITESVELALLLNNIQDADLLFNLKQYSPPENLVGDHVSINYIDVTSIVDLEKLTDAANEFKNIEAKNIEKTKHEINEFLLTKEKQVQINKLPVIESKLAALNISSESKIKVATKFKSALEDKKIKLQKFTEIEKNIQIILGNVRKLFKVIDIKKTGSITFNDFKKILKSLKLDTDELDQLSFSSMDFITINQVADAVTKLYSPIVTSSQVKKAFSEINNGLPLNISEIAPKIVFKNISLINNGLISLDDIKSKLIDE